MLLSRQNKQERNKSGWLQPQEQARVPIPDDEVLMRDQNFKLEFSWILRAWLDRL